MAYEFKEGQGSLFKNEKQNDRQPDYKGSVLIGGVTYEIAAWERTSQRGKSYLSLQASLPRESTNAPKQEEQQQTPPPPAPAYSPSPMAGYQMSLTHEGEDDLPF